MSSSYDLTASGIIDALTVKHPTPAPVESEDTLLEDNRLYFLRDVVALKRERGDENTDRFERFIKHMFNYGENATIIGACRSMRRWIDTGYSKHPELSAFLADCVAVRDGKFKQSAAA